MECLTSCVGKKNTKNYIKAHYCETLEPQGERGSKSFQNGGKKKKSRSHKKWSGVKIVISKISQQHFKLETIEQYL